MDERGTSRNLPLASHAISRDDLLPVFRGIPPAFERPCYAGGNAALPTAEIERSRDDVSPPVNARALEEHVRSVGVHFRVVEFSQTPEVMLFAPWYSWI